MTIVQYCQGFQTEHRCTSAQKVPFMGQQIGFIEFRHNAEKSSSFMVVFIGIPGVEDAHPVTNEKCLWIHCCISCIGCFAIGMYQP